MRITGTRIGWAVRDGDSPYLAERRTKKAAQQALDEIAAKRAWLREQEHAEAARAAAWLTANGLTQAGYRQLQPGAAYADGLYRPARTVTEVKHFGNETSMVFHDRTRVEELTGDMGFTLLTPASPVYGRHNAGKRGEEREKE
jgi:hypothetical protein